MLDSDKIKSSIASLIYMSDNMMVEVKNILIILDEAIPTEGSLYGIEDSVVKISDFDFNKYQNRLDYLLKSIVENASEIDRISNLLPIEPAVINPEDILA